MPDRPYWFTALAVLDVHDGDTLRLHLKSEPLDGGFGAKVHTEYTEYSCRLAGINSIELRDPGGPEAREHLRGLVTGWSVLRVQSLHWDKYSGRYDGAVFLPDGRSVADLMVADGYAVRWSGKGVRPVPVWPIVED